MTKQTILFDPDPSGAQGGGGAGAAPPNTATKIFGSEPAAEGTGGGGAGGDGQGQPSDDTSGAPSTQGAAGGGTGSSSASAPANVMTLDQIKELAAALRQGGQPAPAQPQAPAMSEEEFNKLFNVHTVGEDFIQAIRSDDPKAAVQAFQALVQGIVRQASTLSAFHTMQEAKSLREQFQPALSYAQKQELEAMKNEFLEANPDLKGMEPLLVAIRDSFIAKKRTFDSKDAAFKAVAEEARQMLSKIPGYQPGNGAGAGKPAGGSSSTQRQMPALSGKGQGGGAASGAGAGGQMNTAQRIFGPRRT